jgi:hypothetical protein
MKIQTKNVMCYADIREVAQYTIPVFGASRATSTKTLFNLLQLFMFEVFDKFCYITVNLRL